MKIVLYLAMWFSSGALSRELLCPALATFPTSHPSLQAGTDTRSPIFTLALTSSTTSVEDVVHWLLLAKQIHKTPQ